VLVDNDVNIMALGERATCWPGEDNMIFLKVATGIGSGIISGGTLQRGADGAAGDVGHIAVSRGAGVQCRCGNTACLEAIAGAPALAASLREKGLQATTGSDVVSWSIGDTAAIQAVRQADATSTNAQHVCEHHQPQTHRRRRFVGAVGNISSPESVKRLHKVHPPGHAAPQCHPVQDGR
jgi:predicted NBD/HSP70 family sugar kinase